MAVKELHGDILNKVFEEEDIDITLDESKWYNKNQVIDAFKELLKKASLDDDAISDFIKENSANFDTMFPTMTGTIDGDTMTLGNDTYTKEGSKPAPAPAGMTWTAANTGTIFEYVGYGGNTYKAAVEAIAYGNGTFVAGGRQGKMAYSTDNGKNWTAVNVSSIFNQDNDIRTIAYGNSTFIAGGSEGKIATSPDGVNWTAVNVSGIFNQNDSIASIAYGGGKFVASGSISGIAYSSNGATWTKTAITSGSYGIAYGNGTFVALGVSTWTSTDGINWTGVTNPFGETTVQISFLASANDRFFVKDIKDGNDRVFTSTNGINWTELALEKGAATHFYNIAYGNNKFVNAGAGWTDTSTNGTTWTVGKTYDPLEASGNAIAFGNSTFVMVGSQGKIVYSTGL